MSDRAKLSHSLDQDEQAILLKYFPKGLCAFDLEMTGLSAVFDKIIEIAAVKLTAQGELETFHSLINPLIPIPENTKKYHGLENDDLRDAATLKKPLRDFLDFFGNTPLIAHNAIFDTSFIIIGMNQFNMSPSLSDVYDSCKLARYVYKAKKTRPESFKLNDLAEFFQYSFEHHQAMEDAFLALKITAQCLLEMARNDDEANLKSICFSSKLNSYKDINSYIVPQKFSEMKNWIATREEFELKYKGGSFKGEFRPVKPISLLTLPHGLVLYALCQKTNQNKYFKLKKIQQIRELKKN